MERCRRRCAGAVGARRRAQRGGAAGVLPRFAALCRRDRGRARPLDRRLGRDRREHGARLVEGAWEIEGERRNAGIAACRGAWILEVDSDERVTPELAAEIRIAIAGLGDGYFLVPMANHIGGRLVRHGWGAYNGVARKTSLFHRGAKSWGDGRVHPKIELSGARRELHASMDHFVYRDVSDMLRRLNRYTDLAALDALERGPVPGLARSVRRMFSRAWKSYVARRGYREGA